MKKFLLAMIALLPLQAAEEPRKFDWGDVIDIPPDFPKTRGNQILHFKSTNKPFEADENAKAFFDAYLKEAKRFSSDAEILKFASESVGVDGYYLELGTCTGTTINFIAALNPQKTIYGFDTFEGLPESWKRPDTYVPQGTYGFKNFPHFPPVLENVELIKGAFAKTLPEFAKKNLKGQKIAFLHVDCDLYSSTKTALDVLAPYFQEGTIIAFDKLYNYPGAKDHEFKALQEFLSDFHYEAEYLAFNPLHEQVVVRLHKKTR